jgi:O-antigen/teichoic acid export membrane protein
MSSKENILKNTMASLLTPFLPLLVGFFLMPFIIRHLGETAFGIWALSISLVGYAGLLDLGFSQTVVKKVSELLALNDNEQLSLTCSRIFSLYCIFGLVVAICFYLIGKFTLTTWFHIPPSLIEAARQAFYIIGLQAVFSFPARLWEGMVRGMQKFVFRTVVIYLTTGLQLILTVYFLSSGFGLVSLAIVNLIIEIFKWLAFYIYVRRNLPVTKISFLFSSFHFKEISPLLTFSLQIFLLQASSLLILQTDRVVIGLFFPIAALTTYEVGLRLHDVIRSLVASVQMIILPVASESFALKRKDYLEEMVLKGTKYVFIFFLFLAVPTAVLGKLFISWWVGEKFIPATGILCVLLLGQAFNALNFVTGQVFIGIERLKTYVCVRMISAVLNIGLSIVFLHLWGLVGVALGTAVQFALTDIPLLFYFLNQLGISKNRYLKECILPTFPLAAIAGGILALYVNLGNWSLKEPLLMILTGGLVYVILFTGLFLMFGFSRKERTEFAILASSTLIGIFLLRLNGLLGKRFFIKKED